MFDLSLEVLRVVEDAAIASARTMGMGDPHTADQAAVESMRRCLDTIAIEGTIVIGEGERDKAPMLYIGEKLGSAKDQAGALTVDIAVDPPEGNNLAQPAPRVIPCWQPLNKVACCTHPTATWKRSSSARRRKALSISTLR